MCTPAEVRDLHICSTLESWKAASLVEFMGVWSCLGLGIETKLRVLFLRVFAHLG